MKLIAIFLIGLMMQCQVAFGMDLSPEKFLELGSQDEKTGREYIYKGMFTMGAGLLVASPFASERYKGVMYSASGIYCLIGGIAILSQGIIEQKHETLSRNPDTNKLELVKEINSELKFSRYIQTGVSLIPILVDFK